MSRRALTDAPMGRVSVFTANKTLTFQIFFFALVAKVVLLFEWHKEDFCPPKRREEERGAIDR